MNTPTHHNLLFLFIAFLCISVLLSCKREYSCEGCNTVTAPPPADTLPSPDTTISPALLPSCALCREDSNLHLQSWGFKNDDTYLCGDITEASFVGGKTTFTFFGPSACSADTGLRMTVYLPEPLDGNKSGITTNNVAFYYYDNKALKSILISGASQAFFVTISNFISATQTATGTFRGTVFTSDGSLASVQSGRFNVKLK